MSEVAMIMKGEINECDFTGKKFVFPTPGYLMFARGATGRVCHVMNASEEAFGSKPMTLTYEQLIQVAESVKGGYLDY